MVDLRPLGAPVEPYAAVAARLLVNGEAVRLRRPVVVVFDTGTTGATVSDTLLDTDELPLPGAAIRCVEVVLKTERGRDVSLVARYRRGAEFPLIVTETSLPWFDKGNAYGRRRRVGLGADDDAPPHVVFIGLSFLERTRLTIDLEDRRLLAQVGRNPNGDPPPPKRFKDRSMYALADAAASASAYMERSLKRFGGGGSPFGFLPTCARSRRSSRSMVSRVRSRNERPMNTTWGGASSSAPRPTRRRRP